MTSIKLIVKSIVLIFSLVCMSEALIKSDKKAVLITGCDNGFGLQSALKLNEIGFRVYATISNPNSANALQLKEKAKSPGKLIILQMDVTKDQNVKGVLEKVKLDLTNSGHELWALVNSANIDSYGPLELGTVDRYKQVFEVNVYGTARVTRAFLPLIRVSKGRIINVLSVLSRVSPKYLGPSSMTQHSALAFSDILRQEVSRFGVKVIILEPGVIRANFLDNQLENDWIVSTDDVKTAYENFGTVRGNTHTLLNILPDDQKIDAVVKDIIDSIVNLNPKANYKPQSRWQIVYLLNRFLPSKVTDLLLNSLESICKLFGNSPLISYLPTPGIINSVLQTVMPYIMGTTQSPYREINLVIRNRNKTGMN